MATRHPAPTPEAAAPTPRTVTPTTRGALLLLSPLALIGVVHLVARAAADAHPPTAWLWTASAYWGLAVATMALTVPRHRIRGWFGPGRRRPAWAWPVALLLGLFPVAGILVPNLGLVAAHPGVAGAVLVFAVVNPVVEEAYWRGALLDAAHGWPAWVAILYSTVLFVASHPLMWGVFSVGNRSAMLYGSLLVMGAVWALLRRATGSLRLSVLSHALVDVGNLSVFVFLNLYVPPGM